MVDQEVYAFVREHKERPQSTLCVTIVVLVSMLCIPKRTFTVQARIHVFL